MSLQWLPRAESELRSQLDWLALRNKQAALAMAEAVSAALWRLIEFPRSGRPGAVRGTRKLVVAGSPYLLVYRLKGDDVVIVRLFHTSQKRPRSL